MPNPGMPRDPNAVKYKMTAPEVGINIQKGFPVPKRRKRFWVCHDNDAEHPVRRRTRLGTRIWVVWWRPWRVRRLVLLQLVGWRRLVLVPWTQWNRPDRECVMNKWIQNLEPKKGALHRQLGYPPDQPLPPGMIMDIHGADIGTHVRGHTVTRLLKQRVNFAINAQHRRR